VPNCSADRTHGRVLTLTRPSVRLFGPGVASILPCPPFAPPLLLPPPGGYLAWTATKSRSEGSKYRFAGWAKSQSFVGVGSAGSAMPL
jgi:hypothetical protein